MARSPSFPPVYSTPDVLPEESNLRIFACERCARRKQRCDRTLPTCAPCRTSGATCTRSEREDRVVQGKDREITRKGFVTILLERIAKLEHQIALQGTDEQHNVASGGLSAVSAATATERSADTPRMFSPPSHEMAEASGGGTMPATSASSAPQESEGSGMDISFLSLGAMAEPHTREGEFLKQLSVSRLVASVTETYGGDPETTSQADALWNGISRYIRIPTGAPSRIHLSGEEANKALKTYLEIVDFRFPRLPVDKVRSGIEAISASAEDKYQDILSRHPANVFMAYAVIATVPLVSDEYPIAQGSWVSVHLLSQSLKILDQVFHQEDGVDIIQCLRMLVILSIHCSAAGSAWHLIGFAMNKCIALGYHREECKTLDDIPLVEIQQRRWAFWGCYFLDRLICAGLGRPFSIDDRDITTRLPDEAVGEGYALRQLGANDVEGHEHQSPEAVHHPTLSSKELLHNHLFRYASLLSHVVDESAHCANSAGRDFENYVGLALQWKMDTPAPINGATKEISLHQTSLLNTLTLRICINEVLKIFDFRAGSGCEIVVFEDQCHGPSRGKAPQAMEKGDPVAEQARISRLNLLNMCRAVARSLNRSKMVGRNYLSFLTGYSAFSMGLGCLYSKTIEHRLLLAESCGHHVRKHSNSKARQDLSAEELLAIALQKMDIVGRQFPRMNRYRNLVDRMNSAMDKMPQLSQQEYQRSCRSEIDAIKTMINDIGPMHLRHLAKATLYFMLAS